MESESKIKKLSSLGIPKLSQKERFASQILAKLQLAGQAISAQSSSMVPDLNPEYALDNLLQLEMPAKYKASQVLLNHHSG